MTLNADGQTVKQYTMANCKLVNDHCLLPLYTCTFVTVTLKNINQPIKTLKTNIKHAKNELEYFFRILIFRYSFNITS